MTTVLDRFSLEGRVALVVGGAGHLGREISGTLAELGCDLILLDQSQADLEVARDTVVARGGRDASTVCLNLEDQDAIQRFIAGFREEFGRLDILVYSAALVGTSALTGWAEPFERQTTAAWESAIKINLTSAFTLSQGLASILGESGKGSILFVGSIYGKRAPDWRLYEGTSMANPAAYGVSKAGLSHLGRYLATVLSPSIRVNCVSLGGVARGQPKEFVARYTDRVPAGRMAIEADISGVTAFLCSDASSYVTGQDLVVDGGWTVV